MIDELRAAFRGLSLRRLCSILGVRRISVYERPGRLERDPHGVALRDGSERVVPAFPGYGYRRMTHALRRDGRVVDHRRVLRRMREEWLLRHWRRPFVPTTGPRHRLATDPNPLPGQGLTSPDRARVADISYVPLPTAFVYRASVLDARLGRGAGWELSRGSPPT